MRGNWKLLAAVIVVAWHSSSAHAHIYSPIWGYFDSSKDIYLVKVGGTSEGNVTFVVTDVLRGKKVQKIDLVPSYLAQDYTLNSEWVLVCLDHKQTTPALYNHVGREMEGDDGWIPGRIVRFTGQPFLKEIPLPSPGLVLDTAPNGDKGLTIDHLKQLLQQMPYKPEP